MSGVGDGPILHIARGGARPEEVAAVVVVLLAKLASRCDTPPDKKADRRRLPPLAPFLPAHSWQSA